MAIETYLGDVPQNIKTWIERHMQPSELTGQPETTIRRQNIDDESFNIEGTLSWNSSVEAGIYPDDTDIWSRMNIDEFIVGTSVTAIQWDAFNGNPGYLHKIVVPSSVTYIDEYAFSNIQNYELNNVTFAERTLQQVSEMENYPWGLEDTSIISAEH